MVLRGLTQNGFDDLAHDVAANHHDHIVSVFRQTGTIWENYSPSKSAPGTPSKRSERKKERKERTEETSHLFLLCVAVTLLVGAVLGQLQCFWSTSLG